MGLESSFQVRFIDMKTLPETATRLFGLTRPKAIFCDANRLGIVKESLKSLGIDANVFVFGGAVEGSRSVEELFVENNPEEEFM